MFQYIKYQIESNDLYDEGGYCQFYRIKNTLLGFKEFKSKKVAKESYDIQKKLSNLDLAPRVYAKVCRLKFNNIDIDYCFTDKTNWGYLTEVAIVGTEKFVPLKKVQILVNNIFNETGLKFWDCHWYNIGTIIRNKRKKLVCIDTGKESFDGTANAWGFAEPGPKCCYCQKYKCKCSED